MRKQSEGNNSDCEIDSEPTTLMQGTIRHEIPFAAGKVEIVTEVRLNLNSGAKVSGHSWGSFLEAVSGFQKKLKTPDFYEPTKLRNLMVSLINNLDLLIDQELRRERPNDLKVDFLKQIKRQVEYAQELLEDGQVTKAQNFLNGALDAYNPALEFPDDPTLWLMTVEMFKALNFVSPILKSTRVNKLAQNIGDRLRGVLKNRKVRAKVATGASGVAETEDEIV